MTIFFSTWRYWSVLIPPTLAFGTFRVGPEIHGKLCRGKAQTRKMVPKLYSRGPLDAQNEVPGDPGEVPGQPGAALGSPGSPLGSQGVAQTPKVVILLKLSLISRVSKGARSIQRFAENRPGRGPGESPPKSGVAPLLLFGPRFEGKIVPLPLRTFVGRGEGKPTPGGDAKSGSPHFWVLLGGASPVQSPP